MDQPIIFPDNCPTLKDPSYLSNVLEYALEADDKNEFLMVVRHPDFNKVRNFLDNLSIFQCDAVRIATAVFEGETKGIYDVEDMLNDVISPIHVAAGLGAAKLTKYLIERGDSVDVVCDVPVFNLEQASPIDLALESIQSLLFYGWQVVNADDDKVWTPRLSIMHLLVTVCEDNRRALEVVRLLVQNTQDKECVRQAFIDYANKGKLVHLAALFLAAPDLFLPSPFATLRDELSSLDKRTNTEEGMSLLLDVFAAVGDKLVAFIRVEDPIVLQISKFKQANIISCLLREVANQKLGVSSLDDNFLRLFKPVDQLSYPHTPKWHQNIALPNSPIMPFQIGRDDINIDYVNRKFPSLKPEDAADVHRAIGNKLSSMSRLHGLFLEIDIKSMEREKYLPIWLPSVFGRNFEPALESFRIKAAGRRPKFDSKLTLAKSLEKKIMQPTKLNSLFSILKQSNLPMVVRRFIR